MADPEQEARELLSRLQDAVASKDLDLLTTLFAEDVVLFGTAAANLGREQTERYLAAVVAQDGVIRWAWDTVLPLVHEPELLVFSVLGSVGLETADGRPTGEREVFRLTCVAVQRDGRWLLQHFHGSVPQPG
jgi:uncharacterized protein (TIGR02246 family)